MTNDELMTKHESPGLLRSRSALRTSAFGFPSGFVILISSFVWQICHDACNDKDVHQRDFEKEKPAQPHQLIPAKSRERPAHPHKQENQEGDLCEKDCDVNQAKDPSVGAIWYPRKMPAAEKERNNNSGPRDH